MAKPIKMTIKGSGEAGANAPTVDDLLGQVQDFVRLLQAVESAQSEDSSHQIVWRVTDAERSNPISFELTPFAINPAMFIGERAERIEKAALDGMAALEAGVTRPAFFSDEAIGSARRLHKRVTNGLAETTFEADPAVRNAKVQITHDIAHRVERAFEAQRTVEAVPYRELSSLEGFLKKVELDGFGRAVVRLRARISGEEVKIVATGEAFRSIEAMRLGQVWEGIRVRVRGTIFYRGLGRIEHVQADYLDTVDASKAPSFLDIVDPNFAGGVTAEQYLQELRSE